MAKTAAWIAGALILLGWAAFAFFLVKGLVWIAVGWGAWTVVAGDGETENSVQPVHGVQATP